uniref:Potassium channel domain-containing protein n=1 Tax=Ditylenchus dipsaci TaxID=166011 RepID=A0A915ED51_9BILA
MIMRVNHGSIDRAEKNLDFQDSRNKSKFGCQWASRILKEEEEVKYLCLRQSEANPWRPPAKAHLVVAAAARLGAFGAGFGDTKASCRALYSSVPLESFYERDRGEKNSSGQNHNSLNRQSVRRRCSRRPGSKGYGVALSNAETARERFQRRRRLIERRLQLCNWSVYVALSGLLLSIVDVEIQVGEYGRTVQILYFTYFLRSSVILLTLLLDLLIIGHHWTEVQLAVELLICSCCPFPGSQQLSWPNLGLVGARLDRRVYIPVHVLMTIPMFLRLYLVGRFMVLHSATHQDSSTRAIASFNQVLVDFPFVLRSLLCERPLSILSIGTLAFWTVMSWIMTQCERYATNNSFSNAHYFLDYIWFEVVTFFAIGFGDIEMVTYCGRTVAIATGIVGTITSSLWWLRASLANCTNMKLLEFQWTWRVVRLRKRYESIICGKGASSTLFHLRMAQRSLLMSILDFRSCRWKLRIKKEEEDDVITVKRAFSETEDRLKQIRQRQKQLGAHLSHLAYIIDELSCVFIRKYALKKTTIRIGQLTKQFSVTSINSGTNVCRNKTPVL